MTESKRFILTPAMLPRLTEALRESLAEGRITKDEAEDWCNATYDVLLDHRVHGMNKGPTDRKPSTPHGSPNS